MSARALVALAELDVRISAGARLLLYQLADQADARGHVYSPWLTIAWLAEACGWAKADSAGGHLGDLVSAGLVVRGNAIDGPRFTLTFVDRKPAPKSAGPPVANPLPDADVRDWFVTRFWPRYPYKVCEAAALSVLMFDLRPDRAMLEEIERGLAARLEMCDGQLHNSSHIRQWPAPARWLSKRKWRGYLTPDLF